MYLLVLEEPLRLMLTVNPDRREMLCKRRVPSEQLNEEKDLEGSSDYFNFENFVCHRELFV